VQEVVAQLQDKVRQKKYRLTIHAEKEREADLITWREIEESILCADDLSSLSRALGYLANQKGAKHQACP